MDTIEGDYILTDSEWDELVWVWGQMDVPKGCKTEIIEGLITVTPYSARPTTAPSSPCNGASTR